MNRRFAGLALCLFVGALACDGSGSSGPEVQPAPGEGAVGDEDPPAGESTDAEATVEPLRRANVELYYPSLEENGLVGEFHEIFETATAGDRAKQIVADLISGPTSSEAVRALPTGTRLRQAFVLNDGVAYLDFSSELTEGITGGSMSEILAVYSIVDSVVLNVPEISAVALLVNGRTLETLNGHLDLRKPLRPDYSLILGSMIVESRSAGTDVATTSTPGPR